MIPSFSTFFGFCCLCCFVVCFDGDGDGYVSFPDDDVVVFEKDNVRQEFLIATNSWCDV